MQVKWNKMKEGRKNEGFLSALQLILNMIIDKNKALISSPFICRFPGCSHEVFSDQTL